MNAKKYLVAAIVLSSVLLAFAAYLCLKTQPQRGSANSNALSGPSGKFGPVIETVLTFAKPERLADLLDLETGRTLAQPNSEPFNSRADAIMGWVRSNGLDISCFGLSGGAACVTYDMTIVAVEGKCWEQTKEVELLDNPDLTAGHSPRRLLVLGNNKPATYIFRTGEGTLGMLRLAGLSQDGHGVKICYKLINPPKSLTVAL